MRRSKYQILVYVAMLAAQAVVISIIERVIPSPFPFAPGAKLGLANLITIIAMFTLPFKYSTQVVTVRVIVTMLVGGTLSTFMYSLVGAFFSFFIMMLAKLLGPNRVSIIGISTLGGVMHNFGQLAVAATLAKSWSVFNYMPVLAISGILAGFAVGFAGNYLLHSIGRLRIYHEELLTEGNQATWLNQ